MSPTPFCCPSVRSSPGLSQLRRITPPGRGVNPFLAAFRCRPAPARPGASRTKPARCEGHQNAPTSRAATITSGRTREGGGHKPAGSGGNAPRLSAAPGGERRASPPRPRSRLSAARWRPAPGHCPCLLGEEVQGGCPSRQQTPGEAEPTPPAQPSPTRLCPELTLLYPSREEQRPVPPRSRPAGSAMVRGVGGWLCCCRLLLPPGPGSLWALGRVLPRPCRIGGRAGPEGRAGYGLWAVADGGIPVPRGARGLRSSNPFTRKQEEEWRRRNRSTLAYIAAAAVGMVGMSYAAVPLYRLYCQATGLGGTTGSGHSSEQIESMEPVRDRVIRVTFNADVHSSIQWNFKPQQKEIYVVPGETALAFYKAKNPTDKPIIGISTYNVIPFEAGQYFNKIQCFCFEEQQLNPQEEVDMPVFFYIDPEFVEDPKMAKVDLITLSYTFFEAKEGQKLPLPGYQ
ncbi:cytochrome c oxidase assembly protein COX11, mitochondrial [Heliangelus exortis]